MRERKSSCNELHICYLSGVHMLPLDVEHIGSYLLRFIWNNVSQKVRSIYRFACFEDQYVGENILVLAQISALIIYCYQYQPDPYQYSPIPRMFLRSQSCNRQGVRIIENIISILTSKSKLVFML